VRTLDQFHVVKQRPGRTSGTGVLCAKRSRPVEGITSRPRHCWGFFAESEKNLSWLGLPAVLVRLAPFEQRALKAVTYRVGPGNRDVSSRPRARYPQATGSRTRCDLIRIALLVWLFRGSRALLFRFC
jgi:hypothetical protein